MGKKSVNFLKTKNSDFNNVIDSFINKVDGGTIDGDLTVTGTLTQTGAVTFAGNQTLGDATTDVHTLNGVVKIMDIAMDLGMIGLATATTATAGTLTYPAGRTINNYAGDAQQIVTLPAAAAGVVVMHKQSIDTTGGTAFLRFDCAGSDAFEAGTVVESRGSSAVTYDTSGAAETELKYTPANATTNLFTIGSELIFVCETAGLWHVIQRKLAADPLAVTGAFLFAA